MIVDTLRAAFNFEAAEPIHYEINSSLYRSTMPWTSFPAAERDTMLANARGAFEERNSIVMLHLPRPLAHIVIEYQYGSREPLRALSRHWHFSTGVINVEHLYPLEIINDARADAPCSLRTRVEPLYATPSQCATCLIG